jgi:ribonuclease E
VRDEPAPGAPLPAAAPSAPLQAAAPEQERTAPERTEPAVPAQDPAEIERALEASGLELVQTRPGAQTEAPVESEFVPARRERRPPPADLSQPLVQVETRKEDAPTSS